MEFINKIRKEGSYAMEYSPSDEAQDKLGIFKHTYNFTTHLELDAFCVSINKDELLFKECHSDYALLQAFDRSFWMRHRQEKDNHMYLPLENKEEPQALGISGCPFTKTHI